MTKIFKFEAAHALEGYDGLCRYIHGHSYKLHVTVIGEPIVDNHSPKLGMVMDFGSLKKIVNEQIVDQFDHATVLNSSTKLEQISKIEGLFDRKIVVDYQPTSENMLVDFADRIKKELPEHVQLHHLLLYETASSYAEWFAEDNV
ncbi:MAG: 6-carboxytetrahydropterin synthase [Bacteroidales bacterium]|nr:6-carboxytetrahydropterin synthase [Bacteroidales bacterium]